MTASNKSEILVSTGDQEVSGQPSAFNVVAGDAGDGLAIIFSVQ